MRILKSEVTFTVFLLATTLCSSFFFFGNKKQIVEEQVFNTEPVSKIRGVPSFSEEKYLVDNLFICDNGEKSINISAVNDEYCDCNDGSDEPGTSSCANSKVLFYCINKGYKMSKLPTSRVDDGVCDCCDGSDEGKVLKCPNLCEKLAAKEREALEKAKKVYNAGSKIFNDMETTVRKELQVKVDELPSIQQNLINLNSKLANVSIEYGALENKLIHEYERLRSEAVNDMSTYLLKGELSIKNLSSFLHSLFEVLKLSENDVKSLLEGTYSPHTNFDVHNPGDNGTPELDDSYGDDHDFVDDAHIEGEEHANTITHDQVHQAVEITEPLIDDSDIVYCELYNQSRDIRMRSICLAENSVENAWKFIVEILPRAKQPFREYQLLFGFYALQGTFEGAENFVFEIINDSSSEFGVCPKQFAALPNSACQLEENLKSIYLFYEKSVSSIDLSNPTPTEKDYIQTKEELKSLEQNIRDVEAALNEANKAQTDLDSTNLALLGFKGQKISLQEGRYSYSVYILEKVTQSEGHDVSLGNYKSIEAKENGDQVWKYGDGDYCWNFGARTADVQVTCGAENRIVSAREPSTCYYLLEMESPLACTKEYALANGIQV